MSDKNELEKFHANHPYPADEGVKSLYRFMTVEDNLEFLSHILVDGKLYHATPEQLNDPFECKPHFNWPKDASKVRDIRKQLIRVMRQNGMPKKKAEETISINMSKEGLTHDIIYKAIRRALSAVRLCSYTTKKENLLFWSHYADSHKGICIEFDATQMPIGYSFKVKYQENYPEVNYPAPQDERGFTPVLIKSKAWEYEEEFRSILLPESSVQAKNDGQSWILSGSEVTNIYLGANMSESSKMQVTELIDGGPFTPRIWDTNLSDSSFGLEFKKCV